MFKWLKDHLWIIQLEITDSNFIKSSTLQTGISLKLPISFSQIAKTIFSKISIYVHIWVILFYSKTQIFPKNLFFSVSFSWLHSANNSLCNKGNHRLQFTQKFLLCTKKFSKYNGDNQFLLRLFCNQKISCMQINCNHHRT